MSTTTQQSTTVSADGTTIAVSAVGSGPAVVLVDGALCYRAQGPAAKLAEELADSFTVYTYDRRGRGGSGDTAPYAVEREVEDLAAVIALAGGTANVYGISSGAILAVEAARQDIGIGRLALYEAPIVVDRSRPPLAHDIVEQLQALVGQDRRGDAVRLFMRTVGVPGLVIRLMRFLPVWSKLTGVAHTLPYDLTAVTLVPSGQPLPQDRWAGVTVPTLVMDGGKSPEWMRNAQHNLSEVVPGARYQTLPGQTHMLKASAVAPVLTEFFTS
jgi:pimeloyl-ACP methyl ester carboxylesterase